MKYYSEHLNKFYDTAEDCEKAEVAAKVKAEKERMEQEKQLAIEKAHKEKELAERKAAAEKVEVARKAMIKAQKEYKDTLGEFINKYHTYHYSTSDPSEVPTLFDIFDKFFG